MESAGNLDKLPAEMGNHLLKYLSYNDCLRVRRTCKALRDQVNDHLMTSKRTPKSYVLIDVHTSNSDVSNSLSAFMEEVKLPVSQVYFSGDENMLFNDPSLLEFVKRQSKYITHLKVDVMKIPVLGQARVDFFEAFAKLESFECETVYFLPRDEMNTRIWKELKLNPARMAVSLVPKSFHNLRRFIYHGSEGSTFWDFYRSLDGIADLEELGHLPADDVISVIGCIRGRLQSNKPNLNSLIMRLSSDTSDGESFGELLQVCHEAGVMVENVSTRWLDELIHLNAAQGTVASLSEVESDDWLTVEFPRVAKAHLKNFSLEHVETENVAFAQWPALRALHLGFYFHRTDNDHHDLQAARLLQFAFENGPRPALEALLLEDSRENRHLLLPNMVAMTGTCFNLKSLTLICVGGTDDFFNSLWRGLPLLEYVEICCCPNFGDTGLGLIGGSSAENGVPVSAALNHLKYLEITGLSEMPNVSSVLLEKLIRNLPLRFLRLASSYVKRHDYEEEIMSSPVKRFLAVEAPDESDIDPIATISLDAVKSLNTGKLGETIEKLDISRLYLVGVAPAEMKRLAKQFRSSNMI